MVYRLSSPLTLTLAQQVAVIVWGILLSAIGFGVAVVVGAIFAVGLK